MSKIVPNISPLSWLVVHVHWAANTACHPNRNLHAGPLPGAKCRPALVCTGSADYRYSPVFADITNGIRSDDTSRCRGA